MNKVAALPLVPSVRTLKRWWAEGKTNSGANKRAKLKPGRKGKLSEVKQKVIGGWVIHQLEKKRAVTGERVRQKVRDIFGVDVPDLGITNNEETWAFISCHKAGEIR